MLCDICGRRTEESYEVELEGSRLRVCSGCSKYGRIVKEWKPFEARPPAAAMKRISGPSRPLPPEDVPVAGYGEMIKKAREKLGLTREELGLMINERESILKRIEQESMGADERVLAKLEEKLKLTLRAKPTDVIKTEAHGTNVLTLGDIVMIKKKA